MPSRSPSVSSEEEKPKYRHKHRSRSHSPQRTKSRHKHKHRNRERSRSASAESVRRKVKHKKDHRRVDHADQRPKRSDRHRDEDSHHRPIKRERVDHGYDRHNEAASSRWDEDEQRQRSQQAERNRNDARRRHHRQNRDRGGDKEQWGRPEQREVKQEEPKEKEKPNFELSGKLTEETNTYRGVVIKYSEPPEARKPKRKWRFYPFKNDEGLPILHLHRQSAFLMGRDRKIADIPVDHPSCSKQHAVLQFRLVPYKREDGRKGQRVKPYIIDLGSANGTFVNYTKVEPQRYVELFEKDVVKFGFSSREYVLLHDKVDTSELNEGEYDDGDD